MATIVEGGYRSYLHGDDALQEMRTLYDDKLRAAFNNVIANY